MHICYTEKVARVYGVQSDSKIYSQMDNVDRHNIEL